MKYVQLEKRPSKKMTTRPKVQHPTVNGKRAPCENNILEQIACLAEFINTCWQKIHTCRDPELYCKFREDCVIWFLEKKPLD